MVLTRDDRDRLLVVGGIAWLWFGGAITAANESFQPEPGGLVAMVMSVPLLAALAAFAMWRHVEGTRWPLVVVSVVGLVATLALGGSALFTVTTAPGFLAVVGGALRMRIPPPSVERVRGRRPARPERPDVAPDADLLAFLDAAAHFDREQTRVLSAAWRAVDANARRAAWAEVRLAVNRTGRSRDLDDVRREIELWGRAAGGSPWTWEWATMTDVDRSDVRRAAMPALTDAAAAILVRDELTEAAREALLAPWEAAIGTPVAVLPGSTGPRPSGGPEPA
jgi:hypothetical protein